LAPVHLLLKKLCALDKQYVSVELSAWAIRK
jgi:hypothetical protein